VSRTKTIDGGHMTYTYCAFSFSKDSVTVTYTVKQSDESATHEDTKSYKWKMSGEETFVIEDYPGYERFYLSEHAIVGEKSEYGEITKKQFNEVVTSGK
jgi:hypothetical protein